MDRFAQFAVIAAREAVANAGVVWTPELRETAAIVTGSCVGGQSTEDIGFHEVYKLGHNRVHPLTIPKTMANAGASHISMEFGITGPSFTISTACSSAGHAIGQAFWMVRSGADRPGYCGRQRGAVQLRNPEGLGSHAGGLAGDLPPVFQGSPRHGAGRRRRHAGAGTARSRRARAGRAIHAEIVGVGMSADACHITQPSAEGAARAMRAALRDAGPRARAHRLHQRARHRHAGQRPHRDGGHPHGVRRACGPAGGQLDQIDARPRAGRRRRAGVPGAVMALRDGVLPPTANFTEPDPECDLDVIPNHARRAQVEYALSNSFAFGGLNAVLALAAYR